MPAQPQTAAPPPPPGPARAPEGEFPRWPLWFPLAALAVGLPLGIVIAGMIGAIAGLDVESPLFTGLSQAIVDIAVIGAVVGVAALREPPKPWQFGLQGAPPGRALGIALAGLGAFFGFSLLYTAAFHPKNPQKIVDDLGANQDTALLIMGAIVVLVVAPICEEIFFRGFVFKVLRLRLGAWPAAVLGGTLFGLVHGLSVVVPILTVLGIALCWAYERTGSIVPGIGMHAFNNTIAYGATTEDGWVAAGAVGAVMLAACAVAVVRLPRRPALHGVEPAPDG